jgi:hypothetical protein
MRDSGVVDEDVELAAVAQDLLDHIPNGARIGDVRLHEIALQLLRRCPTGLGVELGRHNHGPGGAQGTSDLQPDAASTAGHHSHAILQREVVQAHNSFLTKECSRRPRLARSRS